MTLTSIDRAELLQLVAGWLAKAENYQWLDFGAGKQILTPEWLRIMTQRPTDLLRVFTEDERGTPIGVVALANVDRHFRSARIWVTLGEKSFGGRGYATRAVASLLTLSFRDLGLHAVNTWIVEHNLPSIRIFTRLGFKPIGRQRQCHYIDGRAYDRLWFDLLASEHEES